MAADNTPWFVDWDLGTSTSNELKQEKQLSASQRRYYSFCRRKVRDSKHCTSCCMMFYCEAQ